MKNILKLFICLHSFIIYAQEVYQGQYKSKHNAFTISNQTRENFTFLQLILYDNGTYKLHTETRLVGNSKNDYYTLDCSEHYGKWKLKKKHLFLIKDFDNQCVEFLVVSNGKKIINKNSKRIKIYKTSITEEAECDNR